MLAGKTGVPRTRVPTALLLLAGIAGAAVSAWLAWSSISKELAGENLIRGSNGYTFAAFATIPTVVYGSLILLASKIARSAKKNRLVGVYLAAALFMPLLLGSVLAYVLYLASILLLISVWLWPDRS
jgi:hypothetical protein